MISSNTFRTIDLKAYINAVAELKKSPKMSHSGSLAPDYNKKLEDKTSSQIKFGRTEEGAVFTETDLLFTIISL